MIQRNILTKNAVFRVWLHCKITWRKVHYLLFRERNYSHLISENTYFVPKIKDLVDLFNLTYSRFHLPWSSHRKKRPRLHNYRVRITQCTQRCVWFASSRLSARCREKPSHVGDEKEKTAFEENELTAKRMLLESVWNRAADRSSRSRGKVDSSCDSMRARSRSRR